MKRQIRRAFLELADSTKKERIFVTQALSGADLKLSAHGNLPKVKNLWIGFLGRFSDSILGTRVLSFDKVGFIIAVQILNELITDC